MLQEASLCGTLRSALSGQQDAAEEKINKARLACEGYHVLPGTMNQPFFVGKPPRWHDNPVGDDEYVVCLNRMAHWNDCIAAYGDGACDLPDQPVGRWYGSWLFYRPESVSMQLEGRNIYTDITMYLREDTTDSCIFFCVARKS